MGGKKGRGGVVEEGRRRERRKGDGEGRTDSQAWLKQWHPLALKDPRGQLCTGSAPTSLGQLPPHPAFATLCPVPSEAEAIPLSCASRPPPGDLHLPLLGLLCCLLASTPWAVVTDSSLLSCSQTVLGRDLTHSARFISRHSAVYYAILPCLLRGVESPPLALHDSVIDHIPVVSSLAASGVLSFVIPQ